MEDAKALAFHCYQHWDQDEGIKISNEFQKQAELFLPSFTEQMKSILGNLVQNENDLKSTSFTKMDLQKIQIDLMYANKSDKYRNLLAIEDALKCKVKFENIQKLQQAYTALLNNEIRNNKFDIIKSVVTKMNPMSIPGGYQITLTMGIPCKNEK